MKPSEIAPDGVALGFCAIGEKAIGLYDQERAAVETAAPLRQREFAAGRRAARRALRALGEENGALPAGPDRTPLWPQGVLGSISHTQGLAVAAATQAARFAALGLDVETIARVSLEIARKIAAPQERPWLDRFGSPQTGLALLFSAKEAWYKAQYPLTRAFFGFLEVEAEFEVETSRFEVRPLVERGAPALGGRFSVDERVVACLAAAAR